MTMVIGLHSPVLGHCAATDDLFIGEHLVEDHDHEDCDHGEFPQQEPCEEEHEFVTVDAGDFHWSPLHLEQPAMFFVVEDLRSEPVIVVSMKSVTRLRYSGHDPPPPGLPVFRRHGVWRL